MKTYCIKSNPGWFESLVIIEETMQGYIVKISREKDGYETVTTEFMGFDLFESCIRTGFITELKKAIKIVA